MQGQHHILSRASRTDHQTHTAVKKVQTQRDCMTSKRPLLYQTLQEIGPTWHRGPHSDANHEGGSLPVWVSQCFYSSSGNFVLASPFVDPVFPVGLPATFISLVCTGASGASPSSWPLTCCALSWAVLSAGATVCRQATIPFAVHPHLYIAAPQQIKPRGESWVSHV